VALGELEQGGRLLEAPLAAAKLAESHRLWTIREFTRGSITESDTPTG
jgi:hypothetical protein